MNRLDNSVRENAIYDAIAEGVPKQCRNCQVIGSLIVLSIEMYRPSLAEAEKFKGLFELISDESCPGPDTEQEQFPRMCKLPGGTGRMFADYGSWTAVPEK